MVKRIEAPVIANQVTELSGCTRTQYIYLIPWPGNNYKR